MQAKGSAYVFVRGGSSWIQQAKLTAGDGAAYDYFGSSVSLSGDRNTALVGVDCDDTVAGSDAGSVYVFRLGLAEPTIVVQPANQTVHAGENATFTVAATGAEPLSYQWRFHGTNLPAAVQASYTVLNAQPGDSGPYTVVITNSFGSVTSQVATLTIAPSIVTQPTNQTVYAGNNAAFIVAAIGTEPLSYQWCRSGSSVDGATQTSYTLTNAQHELHNGATFYCVVTNAAGSATSAIATLAVLSPPYITTPPANQTVGLGQDVLMRVSAGGTAPFSYQWQWFGTNLPGATGRYLFLYNVQLTNAGNYAAVVTNLYGSVTSSPALLTVNAAQAVLAQWNFNSAPPDTNTTTGTLSPYRGSGTADYAGGTAPAGSGFTFGSGNGPALDDNTSWATRNYPAQGTANWTAGVQFNVSTVGRQNLVIEWDQYVSPTASRYWRLLYSTGSTWSPGSRPLP